MPAILCRIVVPSLSGYSIPAYPPCAGAAGGSPSGPPGWAGVLLSRLQLTGSAGLPAAPPALARRHPLRREARSPRLRRATARRRSARVPEALQSGPRARSPASRPRHSPRWGGIRRTAPTQRCPPPRAPPSCPRARGRGTRSRCSQNRSLCGTSGTPPVPFLHGPAQRCAATATPASTPPACGSASS